MLYMKNKNNIQSQNNDTTNTPNNTTNTHQELNTQTIKQDSIENKNNINIINNTTEIKEETPKQALPKSENPHARARGLRKLLNKKAKEKMELLRKYFYKFQREGILVSLRKGTKRASLYKKMEGVELETAFNTIAKSKVLNDIEIDENSQVKDFKDALNKKMEDQKFAEEMEKIKIEEDKKRKEEEERINDLKIKRKNAIKILIYKADRRNKIVLKQKFEIFFLKSKVMSLNQYCKPKRVKTMKKRGKNKRKSLQMGEEKNLEEDLVKKSFSMQLNKSDEEKETINNNEDNETLKKDENEKI